MPKNIQDLYIKKNLKFFKDQDFKFFFKKNLLKNNEKFKKIF